MIKQQILENFIVLEGIDGAGTTTQLKQAGERLAAAGIPHCCTFEPTDSATGKAIRTILKGEHQVEAGTIAYLFSADRYEHIHNRRQGILACLARGEVVICDRYLFSSLAYQSINLDFEFVYGLNSHFPLPGHLIFLEVPVAIGQQRLTSRATLEIFEGDSFQQKVAQAYLRVLDFFAASPMQIHRLDGTLAREEIFQKIWEIIRSLPIIKG